jgi:hypothetical protein
VIAFYATSEQLVVSPEDGVFTKFDGWTHLKVDSINTELRGNRSGADFGSDFEIVGNPTSGSVDAHVSPILLGAMPQFFDIGTDYLHSSLATVASPTTRKFRVKVYHSLLNLLKIGII